MRLHISKGGREPGKGHAIKGMGKKDSSGDITNVPKKNNGDYYRHSQGRQVYSHNSKKSGKKGKMGNQQKKFRPWRGLFGGHTLAQNE